MDTARYVIALLVVVTLPPSLLLWVAIHPFVRFWRRLGAAGTYAVLALPTAALMLGLYRARHRLLAVDHGTSYPLVALAALCLLGAGALARHRVRQLSFAVLSGLPELSPARHPPRLLTEGPYARIRHPRYVEVMLWTLGYALFSNHLAVYVFWLLALPVLLLVVVLEERELHQRFGSEWEEYRRRVPRFVPRRVREER